MSKKKELYIPLYPERLKVACDELSLQDLGALLKAIISYSQGGKGEDFEQYTEFERYEKMFLRSLFSIVKADIDREWERYKEKCETNSENARKRYEDNTAEPSATTMHADTVQQIEGDAPYNVDYTIAFYEQRLKKAESTDDERKQLFRLCNKYGVQAVADSLEYISSQSNIKRYLPYLTTRLEKMAEQTAQENS